jgi:hypothetical protein
MVFQADVLFNSTNAGAPAALRTVFVKFPESKSVSVSQEFQDFAAETLLESIGKNTEVNINDRQILTIKILFFIAPPQFIDNPIHLSQGMVYNCCGLIF